MNKSVFSSSTYSPEISDFFRDAFLSGEKNEGYRFFTKENIRIDLENRVLTIFADENQKTLGAESYERRAKIDSEFLTDNIFEELREGFNFENKIFDGNLQTDDFMTAQKYKPEVGGKIAFTNNKIFLDINGEPYIRMPLANPDINYSFKGKTEGSNIIIGNNKILIDKILTTIGKQDNSRLKIIQAQNPKERILQKSYLESESELGNWTVRVFDKQNNKYTQLKHCYIHRAQDGAFEVMKTDIYRSYEKIEENLDVNEDLYPRVNTIIKLSDLTNFITGDIEVKKIYYKNELVDIEDLPEEFKSKFTQKDGKFFIKDFSMTPPLAMLIRQVKRNPLNPDLKPMITSEMEVHKKSVKGLLKQESGLEKEEEFGKRFNLIKSTERKEILNFDNYEEIIKNSSFIEEEKVKLKEYILELKNKNQNFIILNPDFEIKLDNGKIILIEYKTSKKANQNKRQKLNIKLFMLFGDSQNIGSYNTIIGNNYGIDFQNIGHSIKIYSERFLDEEGIKTKDDLKDFLS